jgi:hypothetical protein
LYAHALHRELSRWRTLDNALAGPHSIASDGEIYVAEDTGRHAVCVYKPRGSRWDKIQRIERVGVRPHRTRYDHRHGEFQIVSSNSQTWTVLTRDRHGKLVRKHEQSLPFLEGKYTRSFTPHDGELYFVSGPERICVARREGQDVRLHRTYRVPKSLGSMNDLYFAPGGWIYLTATPGVIVRTRSLEKLVGGDYENVTTPLKLRGTPYYLSEVGGRIVVPEITEYSGAISFQADGDSLRHVETLYDFGPPTAADNRRKATLPL